MTGIAIGGFLGAIIRYFVYIAFEQKNRHKKWATFTVNSTGSLLLGLLLTGSPFWVTGFLGAFTTFSTLALDAAEEITEGKVLAAAGYLAGTLSSGLCLFAVGFMITR